MNPGDYLTPQELEIYNQSKSKYKSSNNHSLYLYNSSTLNSTEVRYRYSKDGDLLINRTDLSEAFGEYLGEGYQEFRRAIKEIVTNLSDFLNLCTYIVRSIEGDSSNRISTLQKDWSNDSI